MDNKYFKSWLELMENPSQSLKHPLGTSIWIDGLKNISLLQASSFFKDESLLNEQEKYAMSTLTTAVDQQIEQTNFFVSGHGCLMANSGLYNFINRKESSGKFKYQFTQDEMGDFNPWDSISILGNKFYSSVDERIRIPFYTYNHENAHLLFFKNIYSNLDLSDESIVELFILAEWFCISTDLILAYDLLSKKQSAAFKELCRVPAIKNENNIFSEYCVDVTSLNIFADLFRSTFIGKGENEQIYKLIPKITLEEHWTYAENILLKKAREVPAKMSRESAEELLISLRKMSLTSLIKQFCGVAYEAI